MGLKVNSKMQSFCLNRIRPLVRVRSCPVQSKNHVNSTCIKDSSGDDAKTGAIFGRKILIVVDSSLEAKNAVQWALTHTVQDKDLVILLYVIKPSKQGEESNKDMNSRAPQFLTSMKKMCQLKRPGVHIEVAVVEGKERGPAIVEVAKKQEAALLVLGQKKRSMTWRLIMMWAGNGGVGGGGVVEYCIQNASCMAIAVRRKSKKLGGYLITTKRHKDFWLLA
ncbi:Adenine nucleotide alpha hydrolase-like superfamily protein [Abeliophyllum distichum]|uniref:Adenine nucleotide alpha hydrolase-like superfamily protein n=1 Tax=Abeliophyllum distichum TaxID=126358 RepID=A0ABD1U2M0_9LAMI